MQTDFIRARAKAALRSTALMTTILKARMYAPGLGRFLQTDPVGYGDGMNWYGYVGGDPVNYSDPSGNLVVCLQMVDIKSVNGVAISKTDVGSPYGCVDTDANGDDAGPPGSQLDVVVTGRRLPKIAPGDIVPQRVNVDRSCAGNAAANDPAVQAAALAALNSASANGAEFGFFASENIFSSGYSVGPAFSSGDQRGITRNTVDRNQPGFFGSLFNGTYTPSLFVHTHQNNTPPSPISRPDQTSAAQRGITYAAIDRAGNLTCSRN